MKRAIVIGLVLVVLLASIGTVSANLVGNPGFETPGISGDWNTYYAGNGILVPWNIDAQSIDLIRDGWDPASEDQSLDLSGNNRAIISQDISTQPGKFYQLSFAMAGNTYDAPNTKTVEVFWDGISQGTFDFNTSGVTGTMTSVTLGISILNFSIVFKTFFECPWAVSITIKSTSFSLYADSNDSNALSLSPKAAWT